MIELIYKPMLAATVESPDQLQQLTFPVYVSPKLDGVRCLVNSFGHPFTRKGEDFANPELNKIFENEKGLNLLDGELMMGDPTAKDVFTKTSGAVRRSDPLPERISFWVFDRAAPSMNFDERWWKNKVDQRRSGKFDLVWVPQILCTSIDTIMGLERDWVAMGYEGIIIRDPRKPYKHGRASMLSQELMKYKRFADTEGTIIGFEEAETNTNEAEKDAFGRTKRSSRRSGKVPAGRVGTLLVSSGAFAKTVRIGTGVGLTHALRQEMWDNQEKFLGRTVTFVYQAGSDYEKARFPSFKGFRDDGI